MANFDLKLVPKAKEEITKYINFVPAQQLSFKGNEGKIIYINSGYPGKHIYSPYFVYAGTACVLSYDHNNKREVPGFTIDELKFDDIIGFYTVEEWEKYVDSKRKLDSKTKKP